MTPNPNPVTPCDFETLIREYIISREKGFETIENVVDDQAFRVLEGGKGGFQQYIRTLPSIPDFIPYIQLFLSFEIFLLISGCDSENNNFFLLLLRISGDLAAVIEIITGDRDSNIKDIKDTLTNYPHDINNHTSDQIERVLDSLKELDPAVIAILNQIRSEVLSIQQYLTREIPKIDEKIEKFHNEFTEFKEHIQPIIEELPESVSDLTSLKVVGTSYYKWDSSSTYYPTLTFIFKEDTTSSYARQSQIKVRLREKNEELNEQIIQSLKRKTRASSGLRYYYGNVRNNYVSLDKRFKTTIYTQTPEECPILLANIFQIIDEPFDINCLSITTNRKRSQIGRRSSSLDNTGLNIIKYNEEFLVELYRVVLLVNGLEKPIIIFKV